MSVYCLFCLINGPKPKDAQITTILNREKQKILSLFSHFCRWKQIKMLKIRQLTNSLFKRYFDGLQQGSGESRNKRGKKEKKKKNSKCVNEGLLTSPAGPVQYVG